MRCWFVIAVLIGLIGAASPSEMARAAIVTVTPSTTSTMTIHVGDIVNLTVAAQVGTPQSPNDGIFTFDQNFIVANLGSGPTPLEVLSVTRPGADPTLGGGDGTASSTGVDDIAGGYSGTSEGIASPVVLYGVQLHATAPGSAELFSGPSTNPYGADFTLYQSTSPAATYLAGPTLTVAIPEPAAIATIILATVLLLRRRTPPEPETGNVRYPRQSRGIEEGP